MFRELELNRGSRHHADLMMLLFRVLFIRHEETPRPARVGLSSPADAYEVFS